MKMNGKTLNKGLFDWSDKWDHAWLLNEVDGNVFRKTSVSAFIKCGFPS